MMKATLRGKPDAGNPHVRFDEGEVAPAKPRRGSLLYKKLSIIGALALAGCTTQLGQFTVYSPQSLDLSKPQYTVDRTEKVKGVDSANLYLVFPSKEFSYDQAVKNAMARRPGCVGVADLKLTRNAFWLLFGYCDFIAEGYPIMQKGGK